MDPSWCISTVRCNFPERSFYFFLSRASRKKRFGFVSSRPRSTVTRSRELVSGPAILNAVKRRYCVGPSAGSIFTGDWQIELHSQVHSNETKSQTSDVKPISSSAHFLLSTRWRSPETISCSEDGDAQLSARPSGLFLWSCAAGNNNGIFCAAEANKEGTKAVSQRGIQQVLQDVTAAPEPAHRPTSHVGLNYSACCFRVCLLNGLNGERIESGMYIS